MLLTGESVYSGQVKTECKTHKGVCMNILSRGVAVGYKLSLPLSFSPLHSYFQLYRIVGSN